MTEKPPLCISFPLSAHTAFQPGPVIRRGRGETMELYTRLLTYPQTPPASRGPVVTRETGVADGSSVPVIGSIIGTETGLEPGLLVCTPTLVNPLSPFGVYAPICRSAALPRTSPLGRPAPPSGRAISMDSTQLAGGQKVTPSASARRSSSQPLTRPCQSRGCPIYMVISQKQELSNSHGRCPRELPIVAHLDARTC